MIFVDTSYWVAFRNRRDKHHLEALALLKAHDRASLITTNHVRGETWTFLRRRVGHGSAVDFLDALEGSQRIRTIFITEKLETDALRWLRRHGERKYSFVDATSFALMTALRMRETMAFDDDFSAAGFVELRAER